MISQARKTLCEPTSITRDDCTCVGCHSLHNLQVGDSGRFDKLSSGRKVIEMGRLLEILRHCLKQGYLLRRDTKNCSQHLSFVLEELSFESRPAQDEWRDAALCKFVIYLHPP